MAGARAIAQFANGVIDARGIDLGMLPTVVIVGMTGGTIRLVGRLPPHGSFNVTNMTIIAGKWRAVIAWIARTLVHVTVDGPVVNGMTFGAIAVGNKMTAIFAYSGSAVMT